LTSNKEQELKYIQAVLDHDDQQAFQALVERYQVGLINHLYRIVGDQETAEDLAQEAFVRSYRKLHKYNPQYAYSTWLYRIGTNLAFSHLRKKSTVPLEEPEMFASDQNLHQEAETSELRANVRSKVEKLPENYKRVVAMYYWHGMSYEEMAAATNVPVGTIKTWMFRAKAKLKEDLKD
jgi:RNA polymerase sigma-70 factor (ECF subfamily)